MPFFLPVMSIALSVQLKPSRILSRLSIGIYLSANIAVMLAVVAYAMPLWLKFVTPLVALVLSSLSLAGFLRGQQPVVIHIFDNGRIILRRFNIPRLAGQGIPVKLLDKSVLWPQLLSLHLQAEDESRHRLLILPDSTDAESLRALSVALHWIASHKQIS